MFFLPETGFFRTFLHQTSRNFAIFGLIPPAIFRPFFGLSCIRHWAFFDKKRTFQHVTGGLWIRQGEVGEGYFLDTFLEELQRFYKDGRTQAMSYLNSAKVHCRLPIRDEELQWETVSTVGPYTEMMANLMQNKSKFRNCVVTGVAAVICARHALFRPCGMVDMQKGEK